MKAPRELEGSLLNQFFNERVSRLSETSVDKLNFIGGRGKVGGSTIVSVES